MNSLGNKKVELFDMGAGVSEPTANDNVQVASCKILTLVRSIATSSQMYSSVIFGHLLI